MPSDDLALGGFPQCVTLVAHHTAVGWAVYELVRDAESEASVHALKVTVRHAAQRTSGVGGWCQERTWLGRFKCSSGEADQGGPVARVAQTLADELQQFLLKTVR
jgi:hypothetical protein